MVFPRRHGVARDVAPSQPVCASALSRSRRPADRVQSRSDVDRGCAGKLESDMELSLGVRSLSAALLGCVLAAAVASPARAAPRTEMVPVFIYHHVKHLKPNEDAIERGLTILPAQFLTQMRKLLAAGFHTVTAARLIGSLRAGASLPTRPVVLTFDDGYADVFTNVYPVLLRLRLTATFFIVPGFLGRSRYLTWNQVLTMARHGMDIEAHTLTHPDLTTLSEAAIWREIWGSRHTLQQRLHRPVRVLAYPYG